MVEMRGEEGRGGVVLIMLCVCVWCRGIVVEMKGGGDCGGEKRRRGEEGREGINYALCVCMVQGDCGGDEVRKGLWWR